jgi:hypothetical protein
MMSKNDQEDPSHLKFFEPALDKKLKKWIESLFQLWAQEHDPLHSWREKQGQKHIYVDHDNFTLCAGTFDYCHVMTLHHSQCELRPNIMVSLVLTLTTIGQGNTEPYFNILFGEELLDESRSNSC